MSSSINLVCPRYEAKTSVGRKSCTLSNRGKKNVSIFSVSHVTSGPHVNPYFVKALPFQVCPPYIKSSSPPARNRKILVTIDIYFARRTQNIMFCSGECGPGRHSRSRVWRSVHCATSASAAAKTFAAQSAKGGTLCQHSLVHLGPLQRHCRFPLPCSYRRSYLKKQGNRHLHPCPYSFPL